MPGHRTLAVDIGGTGIKLAMLDAQGHLVGDPVRVATPAAPVRPAALLQAIDDAAAGLGPFDRASVGFPGVVRNGRVLTAPHLGTEAWAGFDLENALAARWNKPVRVMNDADVQGYGAIAGKGLEMVLTLGTGAGTALFQDGAILPHLEFAHHPVRGSKTYDEYIGKAALEEKGKKAWNKRVARVIAILRTVVNFDRLYIGGGNAKEIAFDLPPDVTTVPNIDGLTGGIALWRAEDAGGRGDKAARAKPDAAAAGGPRGLTMRASQPKTAAGFAVPRGACDCHAHVIATAEEFPFASARLYTPPPADAGELLALQKALHLSRVVIVQPSVYGTDNACTLDGMRRLGPRARGVAVVGEATTQTALEEMHRAGIRGIRVNLETAGETDAALARRNLAAAAARVAPLGWHVQVYTRLSVIAALGAEVARLGVPVVFDHFGGARAALGADQPGFEELLALVRAGTAYVKVSAAYRSSAKAPGYEDVAPLARELIAANPERILWGSDWPHTHAAPAGAGPGDLAPFYDIDDGLALKQLSSWAPNAALRRRILVDNPARLYDF